MIIAVHPYEGKYLVLDSKIGDYLADDPPPLDKKWGWQGVKISLYSSETNLIGIRYEKQNSTIVVCHLYHEGRIFMHNSIYLINFDDYDLMSFIVENHPGKQIDKYLRRYHDSTSLSS